MKIPSRLAALVLAFITQVSFAQPAATEPLDRAKVIFAAQDIITQAQYATFVTIGDHGQPNARIVDPGAPEGDLSVWIVTKRNSRKAAQLRKNPRATLLYYDSEHMSYASLVGTTSFVSDPAEMEKYWQEKWTKFFPDGAKGADIVLVRFVPKSVEIVSREHKLLPDPWGLAVFKLR